MSPPKLIDHPTFGPCELVPSIVAIRWTTPLKAAEIDKILAGHSLTLASEAPKAKEKATASSRDPRAVSVNQSETLSWVSGLAHCCSCEPEREAAIAIQLQKEKAEALKACLEVEVLQVELERRRMLLKKGDAASFEAPPRLAALQPG